MNILQEVPDSVLWLLRLPGEAEEHLKKEAQKRGVDSERIIFTDFAPIKGTCEDQTLNL
jgi:predicted O-linked N-acetylglucosamine transferase (SPINDLY family)